MDDAKRACVAMVCCMLKSRNRYYNSVYDFKRGKHCFYGVNTTGKNSVGVYDYDRKVFFQGTIPIFFDNASSSFVHLREEGEGMSGYDFQSGQYFIVSINENIVSIYDNEFASYYHYAVG